jgi:hypothetical protein
MKMAFDQGRQQQAVGTVMARYIRWQMQAADRCQGGDTPIDAMQVDALAIRLAQISIDPLLHCDNSSEFSYFRQC